jgi:hypothetical protein
MMALADPYSQCPCGSGEKYKWCCQKVEAYADRSQRLVDTGQIELAGKPLDEGLARFPANPWLSMRKALILLHLEKDDEAKQTVRIMLAKSPGHIGGLVLLTRLVLESEDPIAGTAMFQQALSSSKPDQRRTLNSLAAFVGSTLANQGYAIAGVKHLELAQRLGASDEATTNALASIRTNPAFSSWEKNNYRLWQVPGTVAAEFRESFDRALGWAEQGLWAAAASAFALLSAGSAAGALADRNHGICCLWLADNEAAVQALRRYTSRSSPTLDAVDLESLCQRIHPEAAEAQIEFVHLTWPIRNKTGLLSALGANKSVEAGSPRTLDASDPESTKVERFFLLDRPRVDARTLLTRTDMPLIQGEILIGPDTVVLEALDDGRLDALTDRFTALAVPNIPPAHPRTKVMGHERAYAIAMSWRWAIPPGLPREQAIKLNHDQFAHLMAEVWPKTPHPNLRGRTPLQTAKAGDSPLALRAAIRLLEQSEEDWCESVDWPQLRQKLQVPPEPPIDLDRLDLDFLHLSRLALIPVQSLDDARLLGLFRHARDWGIRSVTYHCAKQLLDRPNLWSTEQVTALEVYAELALETARRTRSDEPKDWIRRGREADRAAKLHAEPLAWDLLELETRMLIEEPAAWVPFLAVLLEGARGDRESTTKLILQLSELGLVRLASDPKRPGQLAVDTQILEYLLSQYGPRVTTATGELGVAASRNEIWTPESAAPTGSSGIWTPGAPVSAPAADRPRLILPGH